MVQVTETLATLSPEHVKLYYTTDERLSNLPIIVFHGASTTANSTLNSSRIQIHIFSVAGLQTFARLTVSPTSPLFTVVDYLPRDRQGDEVCRGLAFGLLKYFKELPDQVKNTLKAQTNVRGRRPASSTNLFNEQHAADLASGMVQVENIQDVIASIESALAPHHITNVDVDLVLPPGSISPFIQPEEEDMEDDDFLDPTLRQYGHYASLIKLFGDIAFLPTSKLRRAPSKPTTLNRSKSFMRDQKAALRREMGELVDTEERYVVKLDELVNQMADEFRAKAKTKSASSFSPSEEELERLFPKSLDRILQVNSAFLRDIRKVMDATEEDAMQDLESSYSGSASSRHGGTGRVKDATGAQAFAKVLLDWFPQFSGCYQEYIRASQDFPQIISGFLNQQSSFSQRVQQTGEQKLRSAVIEPVQRLPRYSLFIDNIINNLPMTHPAMQPMLKARDIITAICSLDPPAADKSTIASRLRRVVDMWPTNLQPAGRLISATDFVELQPPYQFGTSSISRVGMLLLFADCVVVLERARESTLSARGLLAEMDKPSAVTMMASVTAAAGGQKHVYELTFMGWHRIVDVKFTESKDGLLWMGAWTDIRDGTMSRDKRDAIASLRAFQLQGPYDGKAAKWTEEVVKARIEGRFSEKERETDQWALRSIASKSNNLNFYSAIFEEGLDSLVDGRREPAPLRIVVDHNRGTKGAPVGHYGLEIVVNVFVLHDTKYRLEAQGLGDRVYVDEVDSATFLPTFARRVGDLINAHYSTSNPAVTSKLIAFHTKVLSSLDLQVEGDKSKGFRPSSPVKLLSNFLSGGSISGAATASRQRAPLLASIPSIPPIQRSNSQKETPERDLGSPIRLAAHENTNPLVRLEETFTGYVAALHSRKGNILGSSLRNRGLVDELLVNEVYNKFIEHPFDQKVSEMPTDVIFAAFEKFLRMAWAEQMGPVMRPETLDCLQEHSGSMIARDLVDYVKQLFGEMAPQNRRGFIALIKLLADLLDGCGNDGDRGAMTLAFAELLVPDGEPHNYLNLLDRLVEDSDGLFGEVAAPDVATPLNGSMSRSNRSINTGSVTSTSSLRKRFGLDTLLRQGSKSETDRPSVWRTLSKTNRHAATGEARSSTLSLAPLHRSRSIDEHSPTRAVRERPTVLGAFDERPTSSHTLKSEAESPLPATTIRRRKKRRSSLSDLKSLMEAATLDDDLQRTPQSSPQHEPQVSPQASPPRQRTPRTPSPTKIPMGRASMHKLTTPTHRENVPLTARNTNSVNERPKTSDETSPVKQAWTPSQRHSKNMSVSGIPTLRGAPRSPERGPRTSSTSKSPQKLKLQSPQKLRERLQREAQAIHDAEDSVQSELTKIGEEMAKLNAQPSRSPAIELQRLADRMKALESKIPVLVRDVSQRQDALQTDLETALQASEFKVKGLDQLHKEASAENELLYEKFNSELAKIVKAIRGKTADDKDDLVKRLRDSSEETARLKKENARLRREMLTLRTLLKGE